MCHCVFNCPPRSFAHFCTAGRLLPSCWRVIGGEVSDWRPKAKLLASCPSHGGVLKTYALRALIIIRLSLSNPFSNSFPNFFMSNALLAMPSSARWEPSPSHLCSGPSNPAVWIAPEPWSRRPRPERTRHFNMGTLIHVNTCWYWFMELNRIEWSLRGI